MTTQFDEFCTANNIKRTAQRFAVYKAIYQNKSHPTVDDIFSVVKKEIPMITLESVYRILGDFQNTNLIHKISQPKLIRYDCNIQKHSHFICTNCGEIVDIPLMDIALPKNLKGTKNLDITLSGLCKKCAKISKS